MFTSGSEYTNKKFTDLDCKESLIENSRFEQCVFINCNFEGALIKQCKFVECSFKSCSLNLVKLTGSSFVETEFADCKMRGINWTETRFPYITVDSPINFHQCDISYSSFYELKLPGIVIVESKAYDVDFRSADLSSADLSGTDFDKAHFHKTNIKCADFRSSINYFIDPTNNFVDNGLFSLPEVINLLKSFKIKIDDV